MKDLPETLCKISDKTKILTYYADVFPSYFNSEKRVVSSKLHLFLKKDIDKVTTENVGF